MSLSISLHNQAGELVLIKPRYTAGGILTPPSPTRHNTYIPHQTISGTVHLRLTEDTEVSSVLVRFRGKIKTVITHSHGGNSTTYRHKYILFVFEKLLFDGGKHKLRATTYEWPFSFTFPESFDWSYNPFDGDGLEGGKFINTRGILPLPPSMTADAYQKHGSVTYKVRAKVPRNWGDWISKTAVYFSPPRMELAPHMCLSRHKDQRVANTCRFRCDSDGPRSLTKTEIMKEAFRSSVETQIFDFTGYCTAPTVIVSGKPYLLTVRIEPNSNTSPNAKALPAATLHSIRAHLKSQTYIRINGVFMDRHATFEEKHILIDSPKNLNIILPLDEVRPINGVFTERIPVSPNFRSVSIRREYALTVHIEVKVLDEVFEMVFRWPHVAILPVRMEDGVEEAIEACMDGEGLPSYGESGSLAQIE